jgi:hypothetical protein
METMCSKCQAPLRVIALIKSEATAKKMLDKIAYAPSMSSQVAGPVQKSGV